MSTSAATETLGQVIRGPRALSDDWKRFWHLTYNIARTEFKLKFFGSVLGYVWQVMRPLMLFGVLYLFFVVISHVGSSGKPGERFYGVQLLGAVVLFGFFNEVTVGAVRCVVDRENFVRKIQFPRLVIPVSVTLLGLFNFALNLIVVFIFALASGVQPMLTWLELPLIVVVLTVLSLGLAMLLSALFVTLRDIQPIWEVITQVLFYMSPTIVPVEAVQEKLGAHSILTHIFMVNPLATIFQQFRHAMVNHATPSPAEVLGGYVHLLEPLGIVLVIFVLGFWVFNRAAPHVAENL